MSDVFEQIKELIVTKKGVEAEKVSIDSSFQELGMDSLDAVELVADLEEKFNVQVPNTELQNFRTLRQAVEGVERAINA